MIPSVRFTVLYLAHSFGGVLCLIAGFTLTALSVVAMLGHGRFLIFGGNHWLALALGLVSSIAGLRMVRLARRIRRYVDRLPPADD